MIKKTIFTLMIIFLNSSLNSQTFNEYKKSLETGMNNYEEDILSQMNKYTDIFREERALYIDKVNHIWGDSIVNSNKILAEYSSDFKTRRIFNFETGEIIIQSKNKDFNNNNLKEELLLLVTSNNITMDKNDTIAKNTEKRMKKEGINSISSDKKDDDIVYNLFFDKLKYSNDEVEKEVSNIIKNGLIKRETLSNGDTALTLISKINIDYVSDNKAILTANIDVGKIHKKAVNFKDIVKKYSIDRKIPEALVYAVIHNESAFNPRATSHIPAYGLMQLVPKSGGAEAAAVYYGKKVILSPSYLYNPDNNIKLGSTYLSLLYYKYFKNVKNDENRLYCTISAYNTGPSNVAKAFISSRNINEAIKLINQKTPKEVFNILINKLPYNETKIYLKNVSASYNAYYYYK